MTTTTPLPSQAKAQQADITEVLLIQNAKTLATALGSLDFKGSNGWLSNFKARNNIKREDMHAENSPHPDLRTAHGPPTAVPRLIQQANFGPEDVFAFHETALFYDSRSLPPANGTRHSLHIPSVCGWVWVCG